MNIYLMGDMAFVDINKRYMLCIGTKSEVDAADPKRLIEMIQEAIVMAQYRSIGSAHHQSLH